jgi:apolipoprotein N-acyltransferase
MAPTRLNVLLLSLAAGGLLTLAWPATGGLTPLVFVAWLPWFVAEHLHDVRTAGRHRAFTPWILPGLLLWNAVTTWWLGNVSEPLATRLLSGLFPMLGNTLLMAMPWWLSRTVRRTHGERVAHGALVLFWLVFERLHHDWDLQWPWLSLGNVFGNRPAWVQWYDHTGMLGGSLWVLLMNLLAYRLVAAVRDQRGRRAIAGAGLWAGITLVVPLGSSLLRWTLHEERGRAVEVVVVQPNVDPYNEKFNSALAVEQVERMLEQAEAVMTDSTVLVVLPETALQEPSYVDDRGGEPLLVGLWENDLRASRSAALIAAFQDRHPQCAVLTGMSSYRLLPPGSPRTSSVRELGGRGLLFEASNAALFMPSTGGVEHYRKSKLVAGVEQMPFEWLLGPLGDLAIDMGGTTGTLAKQDERTVFRDGRSGVAVAPAICYESVFGDHLAAHVRNGANLIAVMTNDGWWGETAGHVQHLYFAPLRAIETRRAVVRSANTGISCFVDQRGAIHQRTGWWVPDARRHAVHLNETTTVFARNGDLVGRAAMLFALLVLLASVVRRVRGARAA